MSPRPPTPNAEDSAAAAARIQKAAAARDAEIAAATEAINRRFWNDVVRPDLAAGQILQRQVAECLKVNRDTVRVALLKYGPESVD